MNGLSIASVVAAGAVVIVMAITALIAKRSGKVAYVDAAWGASFVAAAWAALTAVLVTEGTPSWRAWVLVALVTVWAGVSTWHLGRRVRMTSEDDPRYESYLGGLLPEVSFARVLVKVFALQALLVIVVAQPLVMGLTCPVTDTWLVVVGAAMWSLGVVFEAVSDAQLTAYRGDTQRPRLLTTGLWSWSRHPNYFGDFSVWWGFWLVGGAASGWGDGLVSVLSPMLMSWILIGVSGVRLAEKRMQGRPGWAAYAARTPIFIPMPPARRNHIR